MAPNLFVALTGLGGFALFMFGMLILSEGLQQASGPWFRKVMATISTRKLRGYILGVGMGATMQSSATTVMAVGFINAGVLSLAGAVPLIAGANFGTTLAMQFIALDKAWMWAALALVGLPLRVIPGSHRRRQTGQALLALALLLLGLQLMGQALYPFRSSLSGLLAHGNGDGLGPMFLATAGSLLFTLIVQSSSATIGIIFSLASSGVIVDVEQALPLLVGAHVGTCITALLSSMGTSPEARRGATSHLYFNLAGSALAFALMPWLVDIIASIGGTPIRQVANLHSLIMLTAGLVIVPATSLMVKLLRQTLRFKNGEQETSHLDPTLVDQPALALDAADRELARITRIIRRGFAFNRKLMATPDRRLHQRVKQTETSVDLIRDIMRRYLIEVAARATTKEDSARLQWTNLHLTYLERISDHNDNLADLSLDVDSSLFGSERMYARGTCDRLYAAVEPALETLESVWLSPMDDRQAFTARLRAWRHSYLPESDGLQKEIVARIASGETSAIAGFFLTEYLSEMDRIVRHTKKIATILERVAT
jgi:phosphate:Na+ symporter